MRFSYSITLFHYSDTSIMFSFQKKMIIFARDVHILNNKT